VLDVDRAVAGHLVGLRGMTEGAADPS